MSTASAPALRPVEPASRAFLDYDKKSTSELEHLFVSGVTPDIGGLVGWEFRGMNTPFWARFAGIKKFVKGFEEREDGVYGYNRPVKQNKLEHGWEAKDKRFGFYLVEPVDPTAKDNRYLHAILLDYGRGGNGRFDPTQGLRDYVVQPDPDNPNLLLGKAYYALGPLRLSTSYFVLERFRQA